MPKRRKLKLPPKAPEPIEIGPFPFMTRGRYWIGDLSSVLSENAWKEVCALNTTGNGHFVLKNGRVLSIFTFPNGDGLYPDEEGRMYAVDSGTIGITLVDGLQEEYGDIDQDFFKSKLENAGHTFDYKRKFGCMSTSMIHPMAGKVSIILLGEKCVINSDDELSGMGRFLYNMAAAKQSSAKEASKAAVSIGNV